MTRRINTNTFARTLPALVLGSAMALSACTTGSVLGEKEYVHGHQLNEDALSLVPEGSSREQAILSLGTPSTTLEQIDGTETLYYISQRKKRSAAFLQPTVVDQRVLAIYIGQDGTVDRIANYGLKDGKAFDFVRRVTPTGGKELTFINQLLGVAGAVANPFGTRRPQPGQPGS